MLSLLPSTSHYSKLSSYLIKTIRKITIKPLMLYSYATEELAEQAWLGIIKKIAHLLPPLTQPAPIGTTVCVD